MLDSLNFLHVLAAIAVLIGLGCDVVLLQRFARSPQLRVGPKSWGIRELALATTAVIGVLILANGCYALIAHFRNRNFEELAPMILPVELALRILLLAGFVEFFRRQNIALSPAVGFDQISPRRAIGWGAVFGMASLPPVGIMLLASEAVCRYLGIEPTEQPVAELFVSTHSTVVLTTLTLFAVVVAPVFEEFFFRGFAYPALKQRLGPARATALVSVAFAATHLHGPSLVPLFALAVGLTLAYELTGSLLTSITMHSLFNGLTIVRLCSERAHS